MKNKLKGLLMLGILALLLAACSSGDGEGAATNEGADTTKKQNAIEIKIGHVATEETSIHKKFVKFKEVLEEESDGQFEVKIYPNSQLGDERELTESTQLNNIQVSSPDIGAVARIAPSLQVFNLPFLFKNNEEAYSLLDGEIGMDLLKDLEKDGLVGLGYAENGWRNLTTKKGPIKSPDELQGVKLRTMEDPLHLDFWKELGLNPTPLAFSEVYTALSQGVVDGQENPLELIESMKFHEVNPYITLTGHIYAPELFVVNKDFFEGLTEEQQSMIENAAKESITYQRDLNAELEAGLIKKIEADGATITILTDEEKDEWIKRVTPVYQKYSDIIGVDLMKSIFEELNNEVGLDSLK